MSKHFLNDFKAVWNKARDYIRERIHKNTYDSWFSGLVPIKIESNTIFIGVTDDYFASWLSEHYGDVLLEALAFSAQRELQFELIPGYEYTADLSNDKPELDEPKSIKDSASESISPQNTNHVASSHCKHNHTFSNFVVGEENRYAFAAAQTSANKPGAAYNPLYIYGGTGTGKTHLLQAVAAKVQSDKPKAVVCYITTEEFLNQYTDALRDHKHYEFRNKMRNVDVLLVDDVHILANKKQLQEEFFNTFNTLYGQHKQIILTSDKQPCEIGGLEERLVSRFESGVTTEISPPGFETRLAILKMMKDEMAIKLNEEILLFLATKISSSVRRLKGAFMRLAVHASAFSMEKGFELTVKDAEKQLQTQLEAENAKKIISIDTIQKVVAEHFDVRLNDILGTKRPKNIAEPRMVAMYLCREMTNSSFPTIGTAFGKNHATIMNAMKKIPELCRKDENFRLTVSKIQRQLQS